MLWLPMLVGTLLGFWVGAVRNAGAFLVDADEICYKHFPLLTQSSRFQDIKAWPAWLVVGTVAVMTSAITCPIHFVEARWAMYIGGRTGGELDLKADD